METSPAFREFACADCEETFEPHEIELRCPACGGLLVARYDHDARTEPTRPPLPLARERLHSLDEGGTPATDCPTLADEIGADRLLLKDEGRNPTGAVTDRGLAVAVSAGAAVGADAVSLPTTGNGGQSAAAYAGRAGVASHSYVPSRCPFVNKAMINVHGGEMNVVEGRYPDALAAYEDSDAERFPVGPSSPYRRAGVKGLGYELLTGPAPSAIVVPTGHGIVLAAIHAAIEELREAGTLDVTPRLYAAQPAGCAPVVDACGTADAVAATEQPDTIVGPLEVPDPAVGSLAVAAVDETGGRGVAVSDSDALQAAVDAAGTAGVELSATGGVALAGARELAAEFDEGTVALVNPVAGSKEDDLLRSHLMSQGI
ncbi:pyridoxal-phosphate dependent enzyme [Halomicrobium sp. IBSBa]|uniref:threonine synthase n=1 Tax=Halomicrobium sp. IBSBa TaxID=2778916 RepID=UPI001ABF8708|nr:pyridoxal-phosphate dependent enzyme [Halomicrobium sp. IBSBa]MBO4246689.1 pyridoxal-phosphate dependent enzyme [Halomicrobium sp. IBSBa]